MDKPKKRGRPVLSPEQKAASRSVRLRTPEWEKLKVLGMEWLHRAIQRAKLP